MALPATDFKFRHSHTVVEHLAKHAARTPPSEDDPPLEYIDRSLTILGRTFDSNDQKLNREFLSQREFIASEFHQVDRRFKEVDRRFKEVDRRFKEMDEKMDRRFKEVNEKMDRRFKEVDERFDQIDNEIQSINVQLQNARAITRNGRLRRMHQPINLIKLLKPTADLNKFTWTSHSRVPKHMKGVYILGQQAKGIFVSDKERQSDDQKIFTKQRALNTIRELAKFYDVAVWSDEGSESDATQVLVQDWSVDDYMTELLDEWGMDWQNVVKLGEQYVQAQLQPQQAGAKRTGEASSSIDGGKKPRG